MRIHPIDRAIAAVAPAWAIKRVQARVQLAAVSAVPDPTVVQASDDSTGGNAPGFMRRFWNAVARDARSDTLRKLPTQRAQSRELARTSPIAVGAINPNIDPVGGTALPPRSQPARKGLGWPPGQAGRPGPRPFAVAPTTPTSTAWWAPAWHSAASPR